MLRSASNNSGAARLRAARGQAQAGLPAAVGIGSYPVTVEGDTVSVQVD